MLVSSKQRRPSAFTWPTKTPDGYVTSMCCEIELRVNLGANILNKSFVYCIIEMIQLALMYSEKGSSEICDVMLRPGFT